MALWVDKHRPKTLDKLHYHLEQAAQLKKLINSGDFPHLLVYGPTGAGKKTRIMCMLRELYGPGVEKLKIEHHSFQTPSKQKLAVTTISSNYHIEVNPSDCGFHDRVVIQELLKTVAQTRQLESSTQKDFKVVVLMEVDKLTKEAQHALRRTMEKYISTCRLILCCNSSSKVIPAIRSRCLGIRVAAPTNEEIVKVLQFACKKQSLTLPIEFADRIAEHSNRNLRRALLTCETCFVQQYPFTEDQEIMKPDWEIFLQEIATFIVQEQSPQRLYECRTKLYELLSHLIPYDVIFKVLLRELIANCDGQLKTEVTEIAAQYEHSLQLGSKAIYHIEAFVAKFMYVYKKFMDASIADIVF